MLNYLRALARLFVSLKLTIVLLIVWAVALAVGNYLDAAHGREWARWYVHGRGWYVGLLGLIAAQVSLTTLIRRPWRWSHPLLVIAPIGLLVLLAGFIRTSVQAVDGRVFLKKDESKSSMLVTDRSQLTLLSRRGDRAQPVELGFSPGPADWDIDEPLDFGNVEGIDVKVLKFYRHARLQSDRVADETGVGQPAIRVAVSDGQGVQPKERWYVPVLFGKAPPPGQPDISINFASAPSLLDDFLKPPQVTPNTRGVLNVHYEGRAYPIPVDENLGKKVPVGEGGLAVELVEYYANAMTSQGGFVSKGEEPKNPMLLLRVYPPGQEQPITEIAYANKPFVTYEAIKKQPCPAKFWYHHPAALAFSGAEFLQTPDEKLYCRVGIGGLYKPQGEVKEGDRFPLSANSELTLLKYIPHAQKESVLTALALAPGADKDAEAAALVELKSAGVSEQVWLRRNDGQLGVRKLQLASGPLIVMFGYESVPLGFTVKLVDFRWDTPPDSGNDTACVSRVELSGGEPANTVAGEISTHDPLKYGIFTISQSSSLRLPDKVDISVLHVTSDPGQLLKYVGGAMIGAAVLYLVCLGALRRWRTPTGAAVGSRQSAVGEE